MYLPGCSATAKRSHKGIFSNLSLFVVQSQKQGKPNENRTHRQRSANLTYQQLLFVRCLSINFVILWQTESLDKNSHLTYILGETLKKKLYIEYIKKIK